MPLKDQWKSRYINLIMGDFELQRKLKALYSGLYRAESSKIKNDYIAYDNSLSFLNSLEAWKGGLKMGLTCITRRSVREISR